MPLGGQTIADVADIVRSGFGEMKSFADKLSEDEITEVSTYVVTEWGAQGDVATGGELFRLNCAGCHGAAGRGGALIYSEQNAPSLAEGSNAITVGAIRGGPGTMPAFNEATLDSPSVASIALYVGALRDPAQPGGVSVSPAGPVTEGLLAGLIGLGAALIAAAWVTRGGRG
jgi:mono/diheme cytochrome c family protein